jgi:hypothetical protein
VIGVEAAIQVAIVFVGIVVFLKFAGMCKKFTLSSGFKKVVYGITAVGLIALNYFAGGEPAAWVIISGFVIVCLFTLALMSETQVANNS